LTPDLCAGDDAICLPRGLFSLATYADPAGVSGMLGGSR
jgi:hypothetical protein